MGGAAEGHQRAVPYALMRDDNMRALLFLVTAGTTAHVIVMDLLSACAPNVPGACRGCMQNGFCGQYMV